MSIYKRYADIDGEYRQRESSSRFSDNQSLPSSSARDERGTGLSSDRRQATPSSVRVIKSASDFEHLLNAGGVLLIDVYGDFCPPCRMVAPKFEALAGEMHYAHKVIFAKQDVESLHPSQKSHVTVVPTFLYYINGKLDSKVTGANINEVKGVLDSILQNGVYRGSGGGGGRRR